jgi:hypothetical protein
MDATSVAHPTGGLPMRTFTSSIAFAAIAISFTMPAALGVTTANRTWVSHSGTSGNAALNPPCTPTNPCDTFATALSATNPSGEINCLDSGSYGRVTITKSVTIDCTGQLGSIDPADPASGTNGVTINSASAVVKLRSLTLNGIGSGASGVVIDSAQAVIIENCVIQNFTVSPANAGIFVLNSSSALQLAVADTLIVNNNAGISIGQNTGAGPITFAIERVRVE